MDHGVSNRRPDLVREVHLREHARFLIVKFEQSFSIVDISYLYLNGLLLYVQFGQVKHDMPKEIAVYLRDGEGNEEELITEEVEDSADGVAHAVYEASMGLRTPIDAARFMLGLTYIKGAERRRLRNMVERDACKQCLIENKGKCNEGHTEKWVKKILGERPPRRDYGEERRALIAAHAGENP